MSGWIKAAAAGIAVMLSVGSLITPAEAGSFWPGAWGPRPTRMAAGRPVYSPPMRARSTVNPMFMRQQVAYDGREAAGTIVVDTPHKFLFYVLGNGAALRYGIGTARQGFEWGGVHQISRKAEWPSWTPPAEMLARQPGIPHHMEGGVNNPLGARALYIGSTLYRIHGTNEPWTIGGDVSSGCIRMTNDDVIDLYSRVRIGAKVIVL